MSALGNGALPVKAIPGDYGVPFFSAIKDRLDLYYNRRGKDGFFQDRVDKYKSTVFRTNMAPGPFMASDPKVIVLLDAKSFPVLFDVSKVEKRDVLYGTYMPSLSLTGGFRVCALLDPWEPNHAKAKQLLFNLLASRKDRFVPEFHSTFSVLFDRLEADLAVAGKSDFNKLNDAFSFDYVGKAFFGVAPSSTPLGSDGPAKASKWLLFLLHTLMTLGLPKIVEELLLHTFHLPPLLVKSDYHALYEYFSTSATAALDNAEKLGLSREEACHNLAFATIFNAYGGIKLLFPGILRFLAKSDVSLHRRLADEIRSAVEAEGGNVTLAAIEKMELVGSVVYEALRMDPPVKYQYGRARSDLVISSHDATYEVRKGEMLFGYQPLATRDARVFGADAARFVAERFVGDGAKLLRYVVWSNGRETESPTVGNKQCAGKDLVVLTARLLLVELFLRYDSFTADVSTGAQVTFTSVTKRKQQAPVAADGAVGLQSNAA